MWRSPRGERRGRRDGRRGAGRRRRASGRGVRDRRGDPARRRGHRRRRPDRLRLPPLPASCPPPAPLTPAFAPDATAIGAQLLGVVACADTTLRLAIYEATWDCLRDRLQAAIDRDPDLVVEIVVDDRECPVGSCFVDELTPPTA